MAETFSVQSITVNGTTMDFEKGVTLNTGGYKRNPVVFAQKVHFNKELTPSVLEFNKIQLAGDSIEDLDLDGATIQVLTTTGQQYIMANAFRTEPGDITDDGKAKVTFNGDPCQEIL